MAEVRFLKINDTYGFSEQHDPTADSLTIAGLTMNGDIVMQGNEVTGLPVTPSAGDSAASKAYVDNLVSGMTWRKPAAVLRMISDADQGGSPPANPNAGDAYVVNNWGAGYNDGDIVEWDGSQWNVIVSNSGGNVPADTRVIVDSSPSGSFSGHELDIATADGAGGWTFTDPQDGWAVLINGENGYYENQSYVYDASTPEWVQFSGAGQITAGAGLGKSGNILYVNFGDGITETPSDYVGIDLEPTTPGLELVGTSPNKQLKAKTDPSGGVEILNTGLAVKINPTPDTLASDASGLRVTGLPLQFKVNDVATGSTVTAANLTTLTDGSNADALHTHNITATDEAKRVEDTHENNVAITAGQVVRWSSVANQIAPADNQASLAAARAIGVARVGGAASPGTSEVVKHGVCPGVLSGATPGTPYFLGNNGALVEFSSIPVPGRIIRIGYAVNSTDLDVQIQDLGRRFI